MTTLLDNLPLLRKMLLFALIGLLLIAVPSGFYLHDHLELLSSNQLERAGIEPVRGLLNTVKLTERHRGLAAMVLNGNADAEPQRAELFQAADATYRDLDRLIEAGRASGVIDEALGQRWIQAHAAWTAVAGAVTARSVDGATSFQRHNELVAQLLELIDAVDDAYGLSLDPEAGTYHLIIAATVHLPALAGDLGRLHGRGIGLLSNHRIEPADRAQIGALLEAIRDHSAKLQSELGKVVGQDAALAGQLRAPMAAAAGSSYWLMIVA